MDAKHEGRTTAPMQPYTMTQVLYGAVVFLVGAIVTFGLGLLV